MFVRLGARGLATRIEPVRIGGRLKQTVPVSWFLPRSREAAGGRRGRSHAKPAHPSPLRQIDHVVLRIRDLNASLHFYCDVLGCTLDKRQESIGLIQVRAGTSLIDLVPLDGMLGSKGGAAPGAEGRNLDHFAIQVTPFDENKIRARFAAHKIEIIESAAVRR